MPITPPTMPTMQDTSATQDTSAMPGTPRSVAMRTASRELGLPPKLLELAVQVGEVRTVCGAPEGPRRVPRAELARLKGSAGFPQSLHDRLSVVNAAKGAELLDISAARFARLACGGCFSPVHFYVNRYRTVVWLYLVRELRAFAERRPELLSGSVPRGLRVLLAEGADYRPQYWRGRRVGQLSRQAAGPWEAAAARAAVLGEDVLEEAVPDPDERARLAALKPELVTVRSESLATRDAMGELCVATAEDEVLWHRLMLTADLEEARAVQSAFRGLDGAVDAGPDHAGLRPDVREVARPDVRDVATAAAPGSGSSAPEAPEDGAEEPSSVVASPERGTCAVPGPGTVRRRARVLSRLRAARRRPARWGRAAARHGTGVSRPAF